MKMNESFIGFASDILGDTNKGYSGSKIVEYCNRFAIDYKRKIVHLTYPPVGQITKRKILRDNLNCFSIEEQVNIINFLCDQKDMRNNEEVKELKTRLISEYGDYLSLEEVDIELVTETKSWLARYPDVLVVYESALQKYQMGQFERNVLDDMRLALELLVKNMLGSKRSLEKLVGELGNYLEKKGISVELRNLFVQIINLYTRFQNENVKHNNMVNETEVEFIIEQTSILMKLLMKVS